MRGHIPVIFYPQMSIIYLPIKALTCGFVKKMVYVRASNTHIPYISVSIIRYRGICVLSILDWTL